jgi:hypothetical protein
MDNGKPDCCSYFEDLREALGRISALADQAEEALSAVPHPVGGERRARTRKLDALVVATATAAREALQDADAAAERLGLDLG